MKKKIRKRLASLLSLCMVLMLFSLTALANVTGTVTFDQSTYDIGASVSITVTDADLNMDSGTAETASVTVTSTTDGSGITVALSETDVDTGIFTASITVSTSVSSADTNLEVTAGDTITVTYSDTADDSGSSVTATDTAQIASVSGSPSASMTEANLDSIVVSLTLNNDTFTDSTLDSSNFTLNNAPTGTSIESVTYNSTTTADVALAFDGTDFDSNVSNFTVTVAAAELTGGTALTTGSMTITAIVESSDATLSALSYSVDSGSATAVTGFASTTYSYNIELPYGTAATAAITLSGTLSDSAASITTNDGVTLSGGTGTSTMTVTAEDGSTTQTYTLNFTTAAASTDATLSALSYSVDSGSATAVTGFASTTYSYNIELPYGTAATAAITLSGTLSDSAASITTNDGVTLSGGSGTATMTVTAEDGSTTQTYTLNFTTAANTDATLSALSYSVDSGSATAVTGFASTTYSYNIELPYGTAATAAITLSGTLSDSAASITTNDGVTLSGGTGTATMTVTAEDGSTTQTYTLNFTTAAASTDATLSALSYSVDSGSATAVTGFASITYSYNIELPYGTATTAAITLSGTLSDSAASITTNDGVTLSGGTGTATMTVTAEDGSTTQTYTLNFTTAANTDAGLTTVLSKTITAGSESGTSTEPKTASISVQNSVSSVASANIVAADSSATVTFYGNDDTFISPETGSISLTAGSTTTVYIKVVAEDTSTTLYYAVTISRATATSTEGDDYSSSSSSDSDDTIDSSSGSVSDKDIQDAIEAGTGTVTIDSGSEETTLSGGSVADMSDADTGLVIDNDTGTVELTALGLESLADSMDADDDLTIEIEKSDASTSNFSVLSDDAVIAAVDISMYINGAEFSSGFDTMTITIPVGKNYAKQALTILHLKDDGSYESISATVNSSGNISFDVTSLSTFVLLAEEDVPVEYSFGDVVADYWYVDAIQYVYDAGIMSGTNDSRFSPDASATRAMIVTILWRLEGEPDASEGTFTDLSQDWYIEAVNWAVANGIVEGHSETTFGPDDTITREQFAAIMYRYASYKGYDVTAAADLGSYTDVGDISSWAVVTMKWANAEGLITGRTTTTITPDGGTTRSEAATIIMRFIENIAE